MSTRQVKIIRDILESNAGSAQEVREYCESRRIFLVNVMGSPGAGKTSFIMGMIRLLPFPVSVIEGDIASTVDADKMASIGVNVIQINTGGACHLIAPTILQALKDISPPAGSVVFIENIGNLVCPAAFDLGEKVRVLVSSVAEGDDKPYKYPDMFLRASAVVLSKTDVKEAIGFDDANYKKGLRAVDEHTLLFEVSFRTEAGVPELAGWLEQKARGTVA
jgi:hydrogenase nickel incorporation protein HypB